MNNKRNLLPEYVWMIFVGMLLAIIILMHITPGHAYESPSVSPVPTSSIDPTDACLCVDVCGNDVALFTQNSADFYALRSAYQSHEITKEEFLAQAYFVRYASAGPFDNFYRDVKIALTQLMAQFSGFHVAMFDDYAATYPYIPLKEAIEEVGCPVREDYYPYSYSTNRVLTYVNTPFINAPVWVWDSAVPTPSPTPVPVNSVESIICINPDGNYYMFDFHVSNFNFPLTFDLNGNSVLSSAMSSYSLSNSWVNPAVWYEYWDSDSYRSYVFVYFSGTVSEILMYNLGSSLVSQDFEYLRSHYTGSVVSSSTSNVLFDSSEGLFAFAFCPYKGYYSSTYTHLIKSSFGYKTRERIREGNNFAALFNKYTAALTNPLYCAYTLGLEGSTGTPDGPQPSSTPVPTSTPVPLPTSGESIHVILPSGTPSPTPPFTIQPGEGGGNGSPGSFGGNGLSSGETSGILQAFSMYVSDNPVFAFLGGLFSAFPAELMYPLYILIFILIILGIIRVFIHFTGG